MNRVDWRPCHHWRHRAIHWIVWHSLGYQNSFIGISKSQTTNLAIVAPGIAEALLATAIGLVAAIPAVIIYNHFSRSIAAYKALSYRRPQPKSCDLFRVISNVA